MKMQKFLPKSERRLRGPAHRGWLWVVAGAVVVSATLLAMALAHLRNQTLHSAEQLNTALVRVVAEQTTRTLQAVDQRLELTAASLALMDAPGERNAASVGQLLQSQLHLLPIVRTLWVLDAKGNIQYDSDTALPAGRSPLGQPDRKPAQDYVQLLTAQPGLGFHIGLPQRSGNPDEWLIQAVRPIREQAGAPSGFVVAVFDPRYFDALWAQMDLGSEGSLVLLRRDGSMLLRVPYTESVMGKNFGDRPVFRNLLPTSNTGSYQDRSIVDGIMRLFSYQTLAAQPDLVVIVGRSESQILSRWRQWVAVVLWVWGSASVVIVALGLFLTRARQRIELEKRKVVEGSKRFQTLFNEAPDAILATAPDGRILAANPASCAMFGRTEAELLALGRSGLVDPSDPRLANALQQRERNGGFRGELRFVRENGETFEGELFSTVFTDQDDQKRATVIIRDTTERNRTEQALRDSSAKLQVMSRRVISAQEAERRRLASELHDELGQSLTAIKINLQSGARFKNQSVDEVNQENIRIVEDALQQVRRLALALRPSILDNLGLIPALGWLGKQMAQRANFAFDYLPVVLPHRLATELETTCFRIVQEGITNIARHAHATQVTLSLQVAGDMLVIRLIDDGVGFDAVLMRGAAQSGNSAGMLGMLERAHLVGGHLEVKSAAGEGCTLTLLCPLQLQLENECL